MNALISVITRTIIRGGIYKGMRKLGVVPTIALCAVAGAIMLFTSR